MFSVLELSSQIFVQVVLFIRATNNFFLLIDGR